MGDDDCMSGAKEHAVPWSWIFPNHGATNQIKLHTVCDVCETGKESKQPSKHTYNTVAPGLSHCGPGVLGGLLCLDEVSVIWYHNIRWWKNCGMELCGLSSSSSSSCRLIDCLFVGSIINGGKERMSRTQEWVNAFILVCKLALVICSVQ